MSEPKRIQFKRGVALPRNTVYVGRPTMWGNPYPVQNVLKHVNGNRVLAQQCVVDAYRDWLDGSVEGRELKVLIRAKLKGKNLACWCKPGTACHADVLLKIANRPIANSRKEEE
jgi:hypothetical protein